MHEICFPHNEKSTGGKKMKLKGKDILFSDIKFICIGKICNN